MSMGILLFNLESGIIKLGLEKTGVFSCFYSSSLGERGGSLPCALSFFIPAAASILPEAHKRKTPECYSNIQRSIIMPILKVNLNF